MIRSSVVALLICFATPTLEAQFVYNLRDDWSEISNPNGAWALREGNNLLPHVTAWESGTGSWSSPQPGWARTESTVERLPFWFRSNGTETFARDFAAGDVVVHTTDPFNGVGSGPANVTWTSPFAGTVTISGGVWMGRDIGRSNNWALYLNGTLLTSGSIFSGDAYSRASPFAFSAGSGGAGILTNLPVSAGDVLKLEFNLTSTFGDFVGVNLAITGVPEPSILSLLAVGCVGVAVARARIARRRRGR